MDNKHWPRFEAVEDEDDEFRRYRGWYVVEWTVTNTDTGARSGKRVSMSGLTEEDARAHAIRLTRDWAVRCGTHALDLLA